MFARKLRIEIEDDGTRTACPLAWMDTFFMRNFTGLSAMDETLPVSDGCLEASLRVDLVALGAEFEKWLRGRKMIPAKARLEVIIGG